MTELKNYGWNDFHQHNYTNSSNFQEHVGRVISLQGFKYHVITSKGEIEAELAGRMLYGAESEGLPKVGDWVIYLAYDEAGYIIEQLPRTNALTRKAPGRKTERQVLGANIDYACIVQGLDRDFNIMRLDRYIAQIIACGIKPIVVLNKADLVTSVYPYLQQVEELKRDVDILCCSIVTGVGLDELRHVFQNGKTYMLIGSSGVGKSSILNALLSSEVQTINTVSDFNNKGRHTTTSRELFQLPNGGLLMDTPGMREFGVTSEDDGDPFPAIDELAAECRFSDCTHMVEQGCAVLEALDSGRLDRNVYNSYVKLIKEQRRFEIKAEDKKRLNRQFGKMVKEAKDYRKKYKY